MDTDSGYPAGALSKADIPQLAQLFATKRNDLQFLESLTAELMRRSGSEARTLHWKVAAAKQALARAAKPTVSNRPVTRAAMTPHIVWLTEFLANRGLKKPDGRALHRHRLSDEEYQGLRTILQSLATERRLENAADNVAALFVVYCAEWFRRESSTTFLRWEDPLRATHSDLPLSSRHDLTRRGLKHWERPLRRSQNSTEYLLTLALEGGIPVRVITDGARGWLKDYLRAIMRSGAAWGGTEETVGEAAQRERWRVRDSYQHNDFVALCSELAWHLLKLRVLVESSAGDLIRNSALLDLQQPSWRNELPVYVPPEDDAVVSELLTGLLDEKLTGLTTEGVETRRYLIKKGENWVPAVQLVADGEMNRAGIAGGPNS